MSRQDGRARALARWGAAALVAAGVAAGIAALTPRIGLERSGMGPVELTMDWAALVSAAATGWGMDPAAFLEELARAGLTSVAVTEQTVGQLVETGQALALSDAQLELLRLRPGAGGSGGTWLLQPGAEPEYLPAPLPQALELGAGLPREALEAARQAGLPVLLRYGDRPRAVPSILDGGADLPPGVQPSRVLVFEGASVPDPAAVEQPMREAGFAVGLVEFASQRGAGELARRLDLAAVAVHSMQPEEMATASLDDVVARYLRAVRERGVRVLYLRPASDPGETLSLVRRLVDGLRREGFVPGPARPAGVLPAPPGILLWLMGLGAGGLAAWAWVAWAGRREMPAPLGALTVAALAGAAGGALVAWGRTRGWDGPVSVLLRQLAALAVALVTPPAAAGAALAAAGKHPGGRRAAGRALAGLGAFWALSAAGGVLVAGLLSDSLFMLRLEQFRGVKLAHALPPALVAAGAVYAAGAGLRQVGEWVRRPIRWVDGALAAAVAAAGVYYLLRTGNEAAAVWDLERALRVWLEQIAVVRPRTKEFAVAFPALAAALCLYVHGVEARRPVVFGALMAAGAVASVSVVNSFAHVHTPFLLTLRRELNGLALGLVTGAAAWLVTRTALARAGMAQVRGERQDRPLGLLRVR